ncbi:UNVERIFIED_CONTAM: Polygalacturonase [Sesamum calycinum]|uniref:Polygalacturonase n=1 Tax=Sesamum calycinum TaxID=2727403 RepID=A0AAW2J5H3_9LAMI
MVHSLVNSMWVNWERCALCSELEMDPCTPESIRYLDQRLSKILKELRLVGRPLYCISTALSPSVLASSTRRLKSSIAILLLRRPACSNGCLEGGIELNFPKYNSDTTRTWSLSQVKLIGNKAPLELQVQGTVQANPKTGQLPNKDGEWITINYVNYFTLSGGGVFDGQGQEAWKQNDCHKNRNCAKLPMNLSFNFINNSIIRDVTTKDSKNFHVNCRDTMINVIDSVIKTGDDCVSIGDETKEVHIQNVTCGPGHGISVGSLGGRPSSIKITNVSIKNVRGTTNSAEAVTLICSSLKPCENVEVGDVDLTYNGNQGPITTRCSNVKPKFVGKQNPPVCATTAKSVSCTSVSYTF